METPKIKALEKEIQKEKAQMRKQFLKEIFKVHGYKIGDIVEFIDYDNCYQNGEIVDFESHNGKLIRVRLYAVHDTMDIERCKLFNENDFTLRHSVYERDLDLEDEFQLIVDKAKSTKYKLYTVYKIKKEVGCRIEYWYYNDEGKLQTVYEGEFHVTKD